jgi:hypothetical protein
VTFPKNLSFWDNRLFDSNVLKISDYKFSNLKITSKFG